MKNSLLHLSEFIYHGRQSEEKQRPAAIHNEQRDGQCSFPHRISGGFHRVVTFCVIKTKLEFNMENPWKQDLLVSLKEVLEKDLL